MLQIRNATSDDVETFKEVVRTSVLGLCKDHYTPEELDSLLEQYPGRELYEKWINDRVLLVAESECGVIGFAQYNPSNTSIEAVHVTPKYTGAGIGGKLVSKIEEVASLQGAVKITLGSSLNAVEFYDKYGYRRKDVSKYQCKNGIELKVVTYEKKLTANKPFKSTPKSGAI